MSFSYTPQQLAAIMDARLSGKVVEGLSVQTILTDSRKVAFAPSAVFFALKTPRNNGHKYIGDLIEKGVKCFVISEEPEKSVRTEKAAFLKVDDALLALQQLAATHRSCFQYPVTAITGSNGKTIVKEWLSYLLSPFLKIVKNPRSYNSQTGVPISVMGMGSWHELAIFEAGISMPDEMERLAKVLQPDAGIFTNIGPAHDEGFPDTQTKIFEKLRLFENCKSLVYCSDHQLLHQSIQHWAKKHTAVTLITWGTTADATLRVGPWKGMQTWQEVVMQWQGLKYHFRLPFGDRVSWENFNHCMAFILARGLYHPQMESLVTKLEPVAMRMEMKHAINNCILINDAYSSDFLSLDAALDFLNAQARNLKKTVIISDIQQSGLQSVDLYQRLAVLLAEKHIDQVIGIGEEITFHAKYFLKMEPIFFNDTTSFLGQFDYNSLRDRGILLKGARSFGFERISNKLQLKDHQTLLEINLDALVHNLNIYRRLLLPGTRIMVMVKAFSYGSGSYEVANVLQFHGVDYLAVAFADEGTDLRERGITIPIVVLNPELHNLDVLFRYNLEPEVYSIQLLQRIVDASRRFESDTPDNPFLIHLKLDTGMHRLGFTGSELDECIALLNNLPQIKVASVFSHLAASDLPRFDDFTASQLANFEQYCQKLETGLGYDFLKHIANSAAVVRHPNTHYDLVRLGIGLYGFDATGILSAKLRNVTTFKSVISQVRQLPSGESVGYNRAAVVNRPTLMAVVPAGYADGLDRKLGNGRYQMLVNGQKAPTLGNISMDMCCLDITGLDAREGDEVVIFGPELPVWGMAAAMDTIPYEVFTRIPPRVKRVYFSE